MLNLCNRLQLTISNPFNLMKFNTTTSRKRILFSIITFFIISSTVVGQKKYTSKKAWKKINKWGVGAEWSG